MNKLWTLLAAILFAFVSTSTGAPMNDAYFANITIDNNENVTFANHTDSTIDGNWIYLSGGDTAKLPSPLTFTYNGINTSTYTSDGNNIDIAVNVEEYTDYVVNYPYEDHATYTDVDGKNEVSISFKGSTAFADQGIDVYLIRTTPTQLKDAFGDMTHGNTANFRNLLNGAYDKSLNEPLDGTGDMYMNFGALEAGDYVIFVLQNTSYLPGSNDLSILSCTTFQVLEYDSEITAPTEAEICDTVRVSIDLIDAPDDSYTYGAVLVHEDAYRASIRLECYGSREETNLKVDDTYLIEGYEVAGIGLSNVNRTTVQNMINTFIGPNNGTVSFKATDSTITSIPLITDDLREGNYILIVGVYKAGERLVACEQSEITISSEKTSTSSGGSKHSTVHTQTSHTQRINNGNAVFTGSAASYVQSIAIPGASGSIALNWHSENPTNEPLDTAYMYLDIDAKDNANMDGKITFRVTQAWLTDHNLNIDDIKLYRFSNGQWNELPTEWDQTVGSYEQYIASTPGFSYFAISEKGQEISVTQTPEIHLEFTPESESIRDLVISTTQTAENAPKWIPFAFVGIVILIIAGIYRKK